MAVETKLNKNAPNPKPLIMRPLISPFLSGNHCHPDTSGAQYAVPIPIGKQTAYTNTNIHHVLTYDAAKIEHIMMDVPARIIILGWNLFNKKAPMGFAKAYITQLTGKMITLMAGVAFASP